MAATERRSSSAWLEQRNHNPRVRGSNPFSATIRKVAFAKRSRALQSTAKALEISPPKRTQNARHIPGTRPMHTAEPRHRSPDVQVKTRRSATECCRLAFLLLFLNIMSQKSTVVVIRCGTTSSTETLRFRHMLHVQFGTGCQADPNPPARREERCNNPNQLLGNMLRSNL